MAINIKGIFNNTYQLFFVTSSVDGKNPIARIVLEPQFQKNQPFLKILARIVDSGFLKFLKRRHRLLFKKPVKAQSSLKSYDKSCGKSDAFQMWSSNTWHLFQKKTLTNCVHLIWIPSSDDNVIFIVWNKYNTLNSRWHSFDFCGLANWAKSFKLAAALPTKGSLVISHLWLVDQHG